MTDLPGRVPSEWHGPLEADQEAFLAEVQAFQSGRGLSRPCGCPREQRPDYFCPVHEAEHLPIEGRRPSPTVVVPRSLLEDITRRLYTAGDDLYREQVEALLDAPPRSEPWCPECFEAPEPDGPWAPPGDRCADEHVLPWLAVRETAPARGTS